VGLLVGLLVSRRIAWLAGVVAAAVVAGATGASAADLVGGGTTVVTPEKTGQFVGTYDRGAGTREFTDRLGAPSDGGTGALVLSTPSDDDKIQFVTREFSGPLARFSDTSYWTRRDPASSSGPAQLPSFQIAVDINGGDLQPRDLYLLTFVPSRGGDEWTKQDAGTGRWCVTRQDGGLDAYRAGCAAGDRRTIAEIVREHPGVSALVAGVNQGGGDGGLVAAVDLVHAAGRTYDFEPG
jgi:hypothetical protein